MLFSEPKIPQFADNPHFRLNATGFSALQRAENSSIFRETPIPAEHCLRFSALQRAENSSILLSQHLVFFSFYSFSALQRAENSSIQYERRRAVDPCRFQCSSASRKFLNFPDGAYLVERWVRFQCSSASRKFLNSVPVRRLTTQPNCFSALQRAENSSIGTATTRLQSKMTVFQCSSASRKFLNSATGRAPGGRSVVSVLFSEPKIPQFRRGTTRRSAAFPFQCSSASRKFLNCASALMGSLGITRFSALQRAENSSIQANAAPLLPTATRFSALQRAENSSIRLQSLALDGYIAGFQCSSASRKFLNLRTSVASRRSSIPFQCSSASRKFLNLQCCCPRRPRG